MSGWQKGDLALCVDDKPFGGDMPTKLMRGRIYTVEAVGQYSDTCCLVLQDFKARPQFETDFVGTFRFIKITPPKPTADDREVIDLMAGKKVGA